MRLSKTLICKLTCTAAAAVLLGACSGTGEPTRSLTPTVRNADFVATMPPTVIAMVPANGPTAGGNTVTIVGNQFDATTRVTFGSQAVSGLVITQTQATFPAPAGEGNAVAVVLSTSQGSAPMQAYRYDAPVLLGLTPNAGVSAGGTTVTLSGTNFGVNPTVTFGGINAPVTSHSHTSIVVMAPVGTPGQVVPVQVFAAGQTNASGSSTNYTYLPATITGILPDHGPTAGGQSITLTGSSFGSSPTVNFNGASAAIQSATESQIVFTLPKGTGMNIPVSVASGVGAVSNTVVFNYDRPSINYIGPVSGPTSGGTTVLLSGSSVGPNATVTVGGAPAAVVSSGPSGIQFITPPGPPGPAPVVVTVAGQSSNADVRFTYVASKPVIENMAPATGSTAGGTTVTLSGSNFGDAATIMVGTTVAPPQSVSNTQITFTLPAGEGVAPVVVTANGLSSDPANFTYNAPTIGAITPSTGASAGGYPVTLAGSNFGLHPSVSVDAGSATVIGSSHTQLVFMAPAGNPGHDALVRVTVAGQTSNTATFHYNAPTLANITPSSGPTSGGTTVTLTGSGFGLAPGVSFNGANVPLISASQSQIVFASPAGQGSANVVVTSNGTTSNTLTFNYNAPSIAALSPATGPAAGGTRVTISGANFGLSPTVLFGGAMVPLLSASHTQIVVNTPAGAPGSVPVIVTVGGKASNAASYLYGCPDGTVVSNGTCATPVAALGNVVAALPAEAQGQLAPIVAEITSKLTDSNPNNDNGACGQLNALSKQTAALLKSGKISASDAAAVNSAIALVSGKAGCK